ncbi:MAG: ribonuclease HI [Selenomonadaceae bacterium]|nr:ribonuclease HI [Selenomonadaceae bacterium]MBP3723410.1 ribonuclease HI [Selenomonadaceae bacterium]
MKQKFYAVKNGRNVGIYNSWAECEKEVKDFKGAKYKSFSNEQDALEWMKGDRYQKDKIFNEEEADFIIYTDGSCLKNPGAGGWAAVIIDKKTGETEEITGGENFTTNNRMELAAALFALLHIKNNSKIVLITDSAYLRGAFTENWIKSWQKRKWKTSEYAEVKNRDLWEKLVSEVDRHKVNFQWVKGHAGNPQNERCDFLARTEAKKQKNMNEMQ